MATKIDQLSEEKIKFDGIFNLKELYEHLYAWFEWRKFDFEEKKYQEKIKPPTKDFEIDWVAWRDVDEYSKIEIKIKWLVTNFTEVEAEYEGRKKKMNQAKLEMKLTASLILDYNDQWEKNYFLKFLKYFYEKYLYKGNVDRLKTETWKLGWELHNEIKAFLNLYRYLTPGANY